MFATWLLIMCLIGILVMNSPAGAAESQETKDLFAFMGEEQNPELFQMGNSCD
ncbi:MAG TPA: hypothetical protein VLA99_10365 [Nitrospiraceae bacterium]|nr:hypothetical protein [Nitrospiraceae bacterium]